PFFFASFGCRALAVTRVNESFWASWLTHFCAMHVSRPSRRRRTLFGLLMCCRHRPTPWLSTAPTTHWFFTTVPTALWFVVVAKNRTRRRLFTVKYCVA